MYITTSEDELAIFLFARGQILFAITTRNGLLKYQTNEIDGEAPYALPHAGPVGIPSVALGLPDSTTGHQARKGSALALNVRLLLLHRRHRLLDLLKHISVFRHGAIRLCVLQNRPTRYARSQGVSPGRKQERHD